MAVYRCRVCGYIFDEEKEGKSIRDIDILRCTPNGGVIGTGFILAD